MKSNKLDFARNVSITRRHWDVPIRVRVVPYVRFIFRLDYELRELVARWIHTAAPNAPGARRRRI